MSITRFAIKNDRVTLFLVLMLSVFGVLSYLDMPKALDPGFTIRTAVINTSLPGASPERVAQLITDKIEQAIQQMPELDYVNSDSSTGKSVIYANFKDSYMDMQPIFDDLRRKVDSTKAALPANAIGPFVNDEFGDVFGIIYTLIGEDFSYAELKAVADGLRDKLLMLDQVAKVNVLGVQDEVVYVEYNNARLGELGLSPSQLRAALQGMNILSSGGNIKVGRERITLEPTGNFESLEEIQRAIIKIPGTNVMVNLEDIARVYRGYREPVEKIVHANGQQALALAISMKDGGNILDLGQSLDRLMPEIIAEYPHGIDYEKVVFQPSVVNKNINAFMINLLQAIMIVLIVMLVFLGFRTGLVVAALVPTTMLITFVVMQFFEVGINKMSLAALIIALGLLVDNAIVIAEGILIRIEHGEERIKAAVATGREMMMPLLVSSLTTAAAFLPIVLAEAKVGEFTADIARVVTISLLVSWLLAMTFIPLLAVYFIKLNKATVAEPFQSYFYRSYRRLLTCVLQYRAVFLGVIVLLFFLGIKGLSLVPKVFIPPTTEPILTATFDMPYGTAIEATEAISADIEAFMHKSWKVSPQEQAAGKEGLINWVTFVGSGAPRFVLGYSPGSPSPERVSMIATATDYHLIPKVAASVKAYAKEKYPDLRVQMKKLANGPPVDYPISIRLYGDDYHELFRIRDEITSYLYQMDAVTDVNDSWGLPVKKIMVRVNQDRAKRAGVSSEDVAFSLQTSLSGIAMTQYREGDVLIPVTLRSVEADRQDLGKLDGITIYSSTDGSQVPLKQVADVDVVWQPGLIKHRDRQAELTINAQLQSHVTATEVNKIFKPWLQKQMLYWPKGYFYVEGGEFEASGKAQSSIFAKLPIAAMLIILLLVWQFNSLRRPAIILLTIPLGMIGVSAGLVLSGVQFGFFTLLGLVSLSGIIINNAIVLLDRIRIEIDEVGHTPQQAILEACQQRARPILLTTATTIGGMLPLWLSHDPMFETMAVAIIFGLGFATVLTLLFVPVMYSLLFTVRFEKNL